jgi:uncharacterized membrane protein YccC
MKEFFTVGPRMIDEFECVASVLLAIVLGHLADVQNISWAAFSGYMVMRGHISESLLRGILRILGTVIGALLALAVVLLIGINPATSAVALALICGVALYGTLVSKHSYAWLFVGLTFAMILMDKLEHPGHVIDAFVSTRMRETVAGTVACILVSTLSTLTLRRRWPGSRSQTTAAPFGWNSDAARHAAQGAIALAMLPFLGATFHIPQLSQAAITIMALMIIPVSSIGKSGLVPVSRRIVLRVAGCVCGAALAAVVLFLAHVPEHAVVPVLLVGTMAGVMLGRHIENSKRSFAYGGTQFTLAILVTLVPDSYVHVEIDPSIERLIGILIGILILVPVLVGWHWVAMKHESSAR